MSALQIAAIIIGVGITIIGWGLLARAVKHFVTLFKLGQSTPSGERTANPGARTATLLREFLGHTRMSRLPVVAVAHWVTMISFGVLFLTLVQATGQLFDPHFVIPFISTFFLYEWITELFAMTGIITILMLMAIRQKQHPRSAAGEEGRGSRFFGSTFWQAYYVELTILGVGICIALLRGMEYALMNNIGDTDHASLFHFPLTAWLGSLFTGMSVEALETGIVVVALIKLVISYAWMITIALTPTMGVAWHRFLAFFNIYFKRHADGRTSLGELQPMMVDGKPFTMESMEEMDEDSTFGVGKVEDFTWKGLLDFSTCTECGRCQDQCPAWNTEKPLSPKMAMMALRDHAHSKAPYLAAAEGVSGALASAGGARSQTAHGPVALAGPPTQGGADAAVAVEEPPVINWGEMALIGETGYSPDNPLTAYNPHGPDVVIDEDVLWSCTTCGACVEQCPVDIEHVDHFVDMRRYQTLIASAFPSELGGLFKKLESKGNPWGMGAKARMDWAKDLPFSVKVFGEDVESADEVDYLFWVGCAGAYEDRAKKTTRAVAELFDHAGVDFAVLGNGETCTGDSARRAGNEVLYQMLAEQNVETLNDVGATKIVVTCAHCFNTIKNEYPQLGGKYEVMHHTQLLNRLVREKKIAPVNRPDGPRKSSLKDVASTGPSVTYHDPCYLGRHNNVYAPPRELISALPGVELKEMERSKEKSFCCGAGGARMWMEEKLGSRINLNRTEEAIATGADRIAVGCPFCRVMLTDGLTAKQSEGASEDIEVVDVAQMLLASVKETEVKTGDRTEAAEQAETATEVGEAKGAAPTALSETGAGTGTAKDAPVEEAGGDPKAVEGQETVADKKSAPSWETGAAAGGAAGAAAAASADDDSPAAKNAAPSWETGAAAPAADDAASKNAAPSWETGAATPAASDDSTASKNAAPSWETGAATPAPAAESSAASEAPADDSVASKNAAPSWETGAATPAASDDSTASKNAAPSWETGAATPAPAAESSAASEAPADDSVASKNAAPSWETGAAAPAADDAASKNAAPSWETGAATPAPAAESSAASEAPADDSVASKNAAPSWETGTATPAPAAEAPSTEAAASSEAPADDTVAAKNAAPSWETGAAVGGAADADTGADAAASSEDEAPAEESGAPQPEATVEPAAPAATDDGLAAKNAAPSWETGGATAAPAAPTETAAPAEESEAPQSEVTEAAPATETTEAGPSAEAPATEQPAAPTPPAATDDSDLAAKNAAPSWEIGAPAAAAPADEAPADEATQAPAQESAPEAPVDEDAPVETPQQEQAAPEAEDPQVEDATADQPEADAPQAQAPSAEPEAPSSDDPHLSDLAKKNAKPSWE
ncbi:heterodisulfide reductase-related iron-sulfur binding cluster [Janibacter cremeus]|uniref:Fe-S oxidoreductase n=1 Tax=Janibacter cremeus TaxID=1285192 RepID=A0A852VS02_9MICO|nr:Fe-S oxidoreductase [Janibacter cremeus]